MAPRKIKKPILVKVGNHLLDPADVACISKVKHGRLYIVKLKSQPNMEFPIWVKAHEIEPLLAHFEIEGADVPDSEDDE